MQLSGTVKWVHKAQVLTNLRSFYKVTHLVHAGKAVGVVLPDFSKAFDPVLRSTLLFGLSSRGMSKQLVHWVKKRLTGRAQRAAVNGGRSPALLSGLSPGAGSVQHFVKEPECATCKSAVDTKLRGAVGCRGTRGLAEGSGLTGALGGHQWHEINKTKSWILPWDGVMLDNSKTWRGMARSRPAEGTLGAGCSA